jgi:hypothetical protein
MNDDLERSLRNLTARGAPAHLRAEVLEAVADELAVTRPETTRRAAWDFRIGMAVAASLIMGVVLNVWAIRSDDSRRARLYGPDPLPRDIRETLETVEHIAGPECEKLLRRRLISARQFGPRQKLHAIRQYQQQLMQLALQQKGFIGVEEDPQMGRDQSGRPRGSASHCQRHLCVA